MDPVWAGDPWAGFSVALPSGGAPLGVVRRPRFNQNRQRLEQHRRRSNPYQRNFRGRLKLALPVAPSPSSAPGPLGVRESLWSSRIVQHCSNLVVRLSALSSGVVVSPLVVLQSLAHLRKALCASEVDELGSCFCRGAPSPLAGGVASYLAFVTASLESVPILAPISWNVNAPEFSPRCGASCSSSQHSDFELQLAQLNGMVMSMQDTLSIVLLLLSGSKTLAEPPDRSSEALGIIRTVCLELSSLFRALVTDMCAQVKELCSLVGALATDSVSRAACGIVDIYASKTIAALRGALVKIDEYEVPSSPMDRDCGACRPQREQDSLSRACALRRVSENAEVVPNELPPEIQSSNGKHGDTDADFCFISEDRDFLGPQLDGIPKIDGEVALPEARLSGTSPLSDDLGKPLDGVQSGAIHSSGSDVS